jgi:hypothetical protein
MAVPVPPPDDVDVVAPRVRAAARYSPHLDPAPSPPAAPRARRATLAAGVAAPVLLALFPVLTVAADNRGAWARGDLATIAATVTVLVLAVEALALAVVRGLGRRDDAVPRAVVLTLIAVAWALYYVPLQQVVRGISLRLGADYVMGAGLLAASGALAVWALRTRRPLAGVGPVACLFGALLAGSAAVRATLGDARGADAIRRSALVRELAPPVGVVPGAAAPGPVRDVYLVVLDGYPNAGVLRETFGYDNRAFVDSLRRLGFVIPAHMRSNYTQTVLSLPSLLNAAQVTGLAADAGETATDRTIPRHLVEYNRAARFFKARGYQYLFFPSSWWDVTRTSRLADWVYGGPADLSPGRVLRRTELRIAIVRASLLAKLGFRRMHADVSHPIGSFAALGRVPADARPTFAFAHFLVPHAPFIFAPDCGAAKASDKLELDGGIAGFEPAFFGQLACVNRLTLALVGELLRGSSVPPVILLVGDHGTLARGWPTDSGPTRDAVTRERFGAFGAFLVPGAEAQFADTVSLVNVLRTVMRHYHGADLPRLPDDAFYSEPDAPYRFEPVPRPE